MLTIDLGTIEYFDSSKNEFVYETGGIVRFEYTLKALYEWEGKWKKPFLKGELTYTEMVDFYRLMALDKFDEKFLNAEVAKLISEYIQDTNTATKISDASGAKGPTQVKNKIHTAEELYAMMFSAGVPLEFENRNLNRLITILKVISVQNNPPKKMTREETLKQNYELNKQRREQMKTQG
jgi:hypothetical protein